MDIPKVVPCERYVMNQEVDTTQKGQSQRLGVLRYACLPYHWEFLVLGTRTIPPYPSHHKWDTSWDRNHCLRMRCLMSTGPMRYKAIDPGATNILPPLKKLCAHDAYEWPDIILLMVIPWCMLLCHMNGFGHFLTDVHLLIQQHKDKKKVP